MKKSFRLASILQEIFILPIRLYQVAVSPILGKNKCRYQPTCSYYTVEAIREWGIFKGTWMGIKRISRCHPWGGWGYDPVPKKNNSAEAQQLQN
jgi:uncharacterized protein